MEQRKPITVSQLNNRIAQVIGLDPELGSVCVAGEITNLKYHNRGHAYFSIKDRNSKIGCFFGSWMMKKSDLALEDGQEIIVYGKVAVYEKGGYYNINVSRVEAAGRGALAIAFEKLKAKLEEEGLFASKYKKPLPEFPKHICVITAPDGAAIKDILRTIREKNDYVDITVIPVKVQGKGAAEEISAAIKRCNERIPDADTIICGRGGGSIEDLWAFNEEIVARAIFASRIPVISAVGHETDFTIADLVSDMRAATPTGAAEMAVPDICELRKDILKFLGNMESAMDRYVKRAEQYLTAYSPERSRAILTTRVEKSLADADNSFARIRDRLKDNLNRKESDVQSLNPKNAGMILKGSIAHLLANVEALDPQKNKMLLAARIADSSHNIDNMIGEMNRSLETEIKNKDFRLEMIKERLEGKNPQNIMERGYSAVTDKDGYLIKGIKDLDEGDEVVLTMTDGKADATIKDIRRN